MLSYKFERLSKKNSINVVKNNKSKTKNLFFQKNKQIINKSNLEISSKYITDKLGLTEINRRAGVIRNELFKQVLAPGGNRLLGNDFVTYLNLLIQQPILIFFYKKINSENYEYRPHFDYIKLKYSRGDLKLLAYPFESNIYESQENSTEITELKNLDVNAINSKRLFQVFGTNYYIRCFLLDSSKNNQPFHEITTNLESKLKHRYEYVRICLQILFNINSSDLLYYSNHFKKEVFKVIEKTLDQFAYKATKSGRSKETLAKKDISNEFESFGFFADENFGVQLNAKQIDFKRTAISSNIPLMSNLDVADKRTSTGEHLEIRFNTALEEAVHSSSFFNENTENIFTMFRAYSRLKRRAVQNNFKGYSYDTKFNLSNNQVLKIESFLKNLAKLGKSKYHSSDNIKNELFGGYENIEILKWNFGGEDCEEKHSHYAHFACSLDIWFWKYLGSERTRDKITDETLTNRINTLIKILLSPVGMSTTSFVDPIYYYGSSIYRMPFRRDGGLAQLHGLTKLYNSLSNSERQSFGFSMVAKIKDMEERRDLVKDCIRVVVFFYLTRFFAINIGKQEELHTKIHLYPIDIYGSVVGAIGKVSYDFKDLRRKKENLKLPTDRRTWDEEIMFLTSIVLPLRSTFRRQYRDLQIDYLTKKFITELPLLISRNKTIDEVAKNMNLASDTLSRVCPYPSIKFNFEIIQKNRNHNEFVKGQSSVDLGSVKLVIQQEEGWGRIFRTLTTQKNQNLYDVSRVIALRFREVAQFMLPKQ